MMGIAVLVAVFVLGFAAGSINERAHCEKLLAEPEAVCTTDEECMRHCPPPGDDPDCDGGPQA